MIRVGIVGVGLIGRERLSAIRALRAEGRQVETAGIFDANRELCLQTAAEYDAPAYHSLEALLAEKPDWIMIALPHDAAVPAATRALECGARVLIEKPLGRDMREAERLLKLGGDRLRVGFNYRFYEGISQAVRDAQRGHFGKIVSIQFELGHGCAPGQDRTWKLDEMQAGGGCLIDPGVHLLDLCLQLAPSEIRVIGGTSWKGFWNTGIEEEVSLLLRTDEFAISLRISVVAWRSTFYMRINGTERYGIVTGRNRSYGIQKYIVGKRWGWREAPTQAASEVVELVDDGLGVFKRETEALLFSEVDSGMWPRLATARDGFDVMKLLDEIREKLALRRDYSS